MTDEKSHFDLILSNADCDPLPLSRKQREIFQLPIGELTTVENPERRVLTAVFDIFIGCDSSESGNGSCYCYF